MASAKKGNSTRDWGRGMACVGRTKECTIVPKDHYGPIPGIDVGTCWKYRLQVNSLFFILQLAIVNTFYNRSQKLVYTDLMWLVYMVERQLGLLV